MTLSKFVRHIIHLFGTLVTLVLLATPVQSAVIDFDFNTLADGANNAAVKDYMQGVLDVERPGETVAVQGARAEKNYNGDRHVVGPVSGSVVTSETLGTSDLNVHHDLPFDAFLINGGSATQITMTFSFPIYLGSFDYEIFPDGTCPRETCAEANWPDFSFEADDVLQFRTLGIVPGTEGTYAHSPRSGPIRNERAPQFLGMSSLWLFPDGVTKLEFIDWPRHIGIDNLHIDDDKGRGTEGPPVVPEPTSLFLMTTGLAGLAVSGRRSKLLQKT